MEYIWLISDNQKRHYNPQFIIFPATNQETYDYADTNNSFLSNGFSNKGGSHKSQILIKYIIGFCTSTISRFKQHTMYSYKIMSKNRDISKFITSNGTYKANLMYHLKILSDLVLNY